MVTVHAFSVRLVHFGVSREKKTFIRCMTWNDNRSVLDFFFFFFCKTLDKINNPVGRERKYTGEDPESQLRPFFLFVFNPPPARFKFVLG